MSSDRHSCVCQLRFSFTTHETVCSNYSPIAFYAKMFKFLELCHILSIVITDQRSMIIVLFTAKQKFPSDLRTVTEYYSSQSLSPSSSHKNDVACEVKQKSFHLFTFSRLVNENGLYEYEPKEPKAQDHSCKIRLQSWSAQSQHFTRAT